MAQKDKTELTTEANVIKNETVANRNTQLRVGNMLIDLIDSLLNILDSTNFWRTQIDFSIDGNRTVTANNDLKFDVEGTLTLNHTGTTGNIILSKQAGTGGIKLQNFGSGDLILHNLGTGNLIVKDNSPNFFGLQYAADYSAFYIDRSLVDKEYVKKNTIETIKIPIGARDTDHTTGTNKVGLHIDYNFTFIGLPTLEFDPIITNGSPTGTSFIVDINVADIDGANEATILSTKLSVDAGEFHSSTAAAPAVLSSNTIAQYKFISIDIDQIGGTLAGKGGFVTLSGYRT